MGLSGVVCEGVLLENSLDLRSPLRHLRESARKTDAFAVRTKLTSPPILNEITVIFTSELYASACIYVGKSC